MDRGTYIEINGRPAVRFQRTYPHPIERVWKAVTSPEEMASWFPQRVTMEARQGGRIEFSDDPNAEIDSGTILVWEPPRRFAFSWGTDELRLELEPDGAGGCTFTLVNLLTAQNEAARNAAGWEVCLAELDKLLLGGTSDGPHSETAEPWKEHYVAYVADGMPSGAEIPGQG
ncbi:SRPBCC family protein [Nonomuraea rhizosphaerae]|uniref:SRPBCC family protein n=1 Tax=Nonomuraea rhizosphaerae TaxID=2665663 RepID=UPI001C5E7CB2|nr:SRPBCC family protein [Nonomuraea rhizosphaerae]